jgi:hypothetical protein
MARDRNRSRLLRQLAECLMAQVPEELLTSPRPDLSTSLVRQWLTYDSHATLLFGDEQHYFRPALGPGGELRYDFHPEPVGAWLRQCMRDWEFGADELGTAIRHLNLGQSAPIENRRGEFLRMWVNPQERSKGIERLGPHPPPGAPPERNYAKFARDQIEALFGEHIGKLEKEDLAAALVRQWALHDGHALILTPKAKFHIVVTPVPDGTQMTVRTLTTGFPQKLLDCGLAPEEIPPLLHLLNLGLTPEVTDEHGRRCQLLTDPKNAEVRMREVAPPSSLVHQITVGM